MDAWTDYVEWSGLDVTRLPGAAAAHEGAAGPVATRRRGRVCVFRRQIRLRGGRRARRPA